MAPPKFIIARTNNINGNCEICLLRRVGKKWHLHKVLRTEIPSTQEEIKSVLSKLSEELKFPWTKKLLKNVEYIAHRNAVRNARRRERKLENAQGLNSLRPSILYFDGTSTGRGGKGACAAVLKIPDQSLIEVQQFLPMANSDVAEYMGLIIGLRKALLIGITQLVIRGDSQLVIYQCKGQYIPINPCHIYCLQEVNQLLSLFEFYSWEWIPRRKNQLADRAASKCFKDHSAQAD